MQKLALGILALLVLALAAMNSRLQHRERILAERLAAAEKRSTRKPPTILPPEPESLPVPAKAPVTPPTQARTEVTAPATVYLEEKMSSSPPLKHVILANRFTIDSGRLVFSAVDPENPLTEALDEGASGWKAGYLGISGNDAPGGGAQVTAVHAGTAAGAVGLQPGDVILDVNGEPIPTLSALSRKIRRTGEGFAATLRIRRDGVEFIQGVQLGGAPK